MAKADRIQQLELELNQAKEKNRELQMVQEFVAVGLRALSLRMLTTFALLADFVLFAWCVASPSWVSLAAAVLFAIASWAVLHLKPERKDE